MMTWVAVAIGGALGSMARHAADRLIQHHWLGRSFPLSVFLINVVGSATIGLIAGLLASGRVEMSNTWRVFLVVGILGGFTTFSSFSLDNLTLVNSGHYAQAAANGFGQVVLGFGAAWLAFVAAHAGVKGHF